MNNLEYEKSRKILKSATEKKETDIEGAITLIKEAIKICPEKILDDYFKLANYYYIANKKDQTFGLLEKLINDFDINEIGMYNMNKSLVNDKLCILHYKGNDYVLYLKNYSFWLYNTAVAFACQGRASELKNIIENPNKLDYLAPTKVNNCFKKLN
nr:hypothetical protein [Chitinophagales bacterium]